MFLVARLARGLARKLVSKSVHVLISIHRDKVVLLGRTSHGCHFDGTSDGSRDNSLNYIDLYIL